MSEVTDTIAAIATPPGRGGVGIVRVSGPAVAAIGHRLSGRLPKPRYATLTDFRSASGELIDHGLLLYFPAPHSFTGEDVIELQAHGGPVILDLLLQAVLAAGARLARPGEFSERAFLNDKLDLAQAEAIADLIDSASASAARAALRSLDGEFSRAVDRLREQLIALRLYVEGAIDFPEEEIDFLASGDIAQRLDAVRRTAQALLVVAKQGSVLRDGITIVIAGPPNAGKSSLMNRLSQRETAIVTDIPGTTRDILREAVTLDGIPLHLIDTAGLRDSDDPIEREGIERARREIGRADVILYLTDISQPSDGPDSAPAMLAPGVPLIHVHNKIDLVPTAAASAATGEPHVYLSAKTGTGLPSLIDGIKQLLGLQPQMAGTFSARRRHLDALQRTLHHIECGQQRSDQGAGELVAEELKAAQDCLSEITGEFTSDDLLGEIFASFCIGK